MAKKKDWLIFIKDDKYYAVENLHDKRPPEKIGGCYVLAHVSFETPAEAIGYVQSILEY